MAIDIWDPNLIKEIAGGWEDEVEKHDRRTSSTFDAGICRKQTAGGNGRWAGGAIVKNIPNNALAYTFGGATLLPLFVSSRSMS